jgi:hypothetical protein
MNLLAIFLVAQTAKHPPVLVPDVAIYTQKPSKRTVNVLKLYPDNTYNFCRYKATRIQRDTGTFKGKHRKLTFLSTERRHSFNPLTQKPVLKGKKGIYLKPMRGRIGGKPDFLISKNPQEYNKPWNYNPITKRLEEELVEVKPSATSSASTQIAIEAAKRYYLNTTAQYTHGYNTILENNYSGPGLYSTYINGIFVTWDEDTSDAKLFGDLNTVVHESVHTYNNNHYLIIPGITIPVNETETCHSSDFNILVSKDLQQKIFRWNNYVSKESGVTANLMGIYGIMDEFSAYMNGTRAGLMAAAKLEAQGNHQKADIQLEHASRTYFAWYEFRLFTAWYLHYTHQNRREIYNKIMENNNLRLTYTLIDNEFEKIISEAGRMCINNNCDVWKNYADRYRKYVEPCTKELVKEEKWLSDFRLQGATLQNYKDYLTPGLTAAN